MTDAEPKTPEVMPSPENPDEAPPPAPENPDEAPSVAEPAETAEQAGTEEEAAVKSSRRAVLDEVLEQAPVSNRWIQEKFS